MQHFAWLAVDDQSLGGFAITTWLPPEEPAELETVVVDAPFRRQGVGSALLRACMLAAAQAGATSIRLEVRESNLAARSLYQHNGFSLYWQETWLLFRSRGRCDPVAGSVRLIRVADPSYNSARVDTYTWFVTDLSYGFGFLAAAILVGLITGNWIWAVLPRSFWHGSSCGFSATPA